MVDVHQSASRDLSRLLLAALALDPFGPGLTEQELKAAAIQLGMSAAVFSEVIKKFWEDRAAQYSDQTIAASSTDLVLMGALGNGYTFPPIFPMATIPRLADAFTRLEKKHGVNTSKSLETILSECPDPPEQTKLALAILVTHKNVQRVGDGFRRLLNIGVSYGTVDPAHPATQALKAAMAAVEPIVAARAGTTLPAIKPIERFHGFLRKQGWTGMAEWWGATAQELVGLWDYYPTAATILAGAMLEAALVAIAEPSRLAGEWNHKFLNEDPRNWQLRDLIKQAEAAKTFSANEAAHARTLADIRNRIHAGRFAFGGPDPFRPPSTNTHEAQIAKLHLDLLLTRILEWKPIAALT
jgi:hypothetical protein